ncbi:unnamed protein product [Rodentolepis nana]|uniref:DUF5734 domain-containing protein n=1 Tax=Rodentolepis nana TaxID=102285 RepID=A0A0R3TYC7_RODNA|nr:unnamed protein product [Rodentolepis nana]
MTEFLVSCLRTGKCNKPEKLEDKMIKELRKTAGINKNKNIKCQVKNKKVEFEGKKKVIDCENIERIQRNKDYGVIMVVTKTKKNRMKLFTMRFLDNSEFVRFYDTINPNPTSVVFSQKLEQSITPKQDETGKFNRYPTPVSPLSESSSTTVEAQSSRKVTRHSNSVKGLVVEERSSSSHSSFSSRLLTPTPQRQRNRPKSEISQVEHELPSRLSSYETKSQATRDRPDSHKMEIVDGHGYVRF